MRIILAFVGIVLLINSASTRIRHLHRNYSFNQERMHPLSDEFIEHLNSSQTLWNAGRNFHKHTPWSYIRGLMGTYEDDPKIYEIFLDEAPKHEVTELPNSFDSRDSWPYCESISDIRDQGSCSSCWAVGVASVMSDRICILTSGTETVYFSEEDILGCCHECIEFSSACLGGSATKAWGFTKRVGVVSGGVYNSKGGCKAYHIKPCNHEYSGRRERCQQKTETQKCVSTCTTNSEIDYKFDKKRFTHIYNIPYSANEESPKAMSDIMEYGPITALLSVYADFIHYKSGIYRRTDSASNTFIGNHTVKIIGWGEDKVTDTKYWIVANSWNAGWGDHGFFKIVRDENHCNIESHLNAGKL